MDISGNNNNRTGTLIVVQRKNYLTPINMKEFDKGLEGGEAAGAAAGSTSTPSANGARMYVRTQGFGEATDADLRFLQRCPAAVTIATNSSLDGVL